MQMTCLKGLSDDR